MARKLASLLSSAALAALFLSSHASAAIPVEESVEDPRPGEPVAKPLTREGLEERRSQPQVQRRRAPDLDIPPTIEPSPVIEEDVPPAQSVVVTPGAGNGLGDLFYQIQILQQEIQDLRGQLEEQKYLVKQLQQDSEDQYLDLDRRMLALSQNRPAPPPTATPTAEPEVADGPPTTEREAYTRAYDAVTKTQQYEEAIAGFEQLIREYPNGQFTPNAFYWSGEAFLKIDELERARQSFMQVINLYPDHQKTPPAMFKLGVVYASLSDEERAMRFLNRVRREFPNTRAAELAEEYAAELTR